ncbi:glycosyl hydrolase [Methylobacterium brachythecii]|uniref:Glycosyl hydrolase n=1 Tax=Methylobacterium brachythecii TaxID=1176177 RepID=A0ABQ6D882_9HYPH|nr:glycosyl hydrolase [Methylobacterium brachythecii]
MVGLALLLAGSATAEAGDALFRHGIGVHSLLNWGTLEPNRSDHYAARPFSDVDHELPDALLEAVAKAGFDFVRLTVDPGPFMQLTGAARDALDDRLAATVRRIQRLGLAVVVDLHSNTQVAAYDAQAIIATADSALFRSYVALVRRTARLLAGLARTDVAFELMNEPPYGYDPESRRRWQGMMETLHAAARAEAPEMTLILTGSHGGDREGLLALDAAPFRGSRVLYSFHYYEPYDFTHQGVPEEGIAGRYRQYLSGMPYPAASVPRAAVEAGVRANIDADPDLDFATRLLVQRQAAAKIDTYLRAGADRTMIARHFQEVADWARRNGIHGDQIFLGEFGATRSYDNHRAASADSYQNWIGDVRREAEARGFGWAIWALTGTGGMALVSTDGGTQLDIGSSCALGLACR